MGDSITAGVDSTVGVYSIDPVHNYAAVSAAALGFPMTDAAIPGTLCAQMTATEMPTIPTNASIVIVNAGTNNIWPIAQPWLYGTVPATALAAGLADYDALIAAIRMRAPNARLVFITIRDFGRGGTDTASVDATAAVAAWDTHERAVAASLGAAVLDLQTDPQWYISTEWPDNVHPTIQGAAHLATALEPLL